MQYSPGITPPARNGAELLQRLREPVGRIRFSRCKESGWLSGSASAVSLCCSLYNNADAVRKALALAEALRANKEVVIQAMVGSCRCQTKTPELQYHAQDCLYRVLGETLLE